MHRYIWLVPLLPLAGAAINGLLGRKFRFSEKLIGGIAVGSVALSFLISLAAVYSYGFSSHSIWPKPYVTSQDGFQFHLDSRRRSASSPRAQQNVSAQQRSEERLHGTRRSSTAAPPTARCREPAQLSAQHRMELSTRSAVVDLHADRHRRRPVHLCFRHRLHARRPGLLSLLRLHGSVHVFDARPGDGLKLPDDVCRLGRSRSLFVPADRLLLRSPGSRRTLHARRSSRTASATSDSRSRSSASLPRSAATQYTDVFAQAKGFPLEAARSLGHSVLDRARTFHRRLRQVGATSTARLAARRDGWSNACLGADPRRHDGHRRPLHGDAHQRHLPALANDDAGRRARRRGDCDLRRHDRHHSERHQEGSGLLDCLAARLHVHGLRRRRVCRSASST